MLTALKELTFKKVAITGAGAAVGYVVVDKILGTLGAKLGSLIGGAK